MALRSSNISDEMIYGGPIDPTNPSYPHVRAMRERIRQYELARDAQITTIRSQYNVEYEDAILIDNYLEKLKVIHQNERLGLFTLDHLMPRKPQALIDWEQARLTDSERKMSFGSQTMRGYHPRLR